MGQFSSCLSDCLGFRKDHPDHDRLLSTDYPNHDHGTFDYPHRTGQGSYGSGVRGGDIDPQDQIREREALERIVTNASMNLIDIFAHAPPHTGTSTPSQSQYHPQKSTSAPHLRRELSSGSGVGPNNYGGHDAKMMAIYRAVLQKTSPPHLPTMPEVLPVSVVSEEERNWLEDIGARADEAVGYLTRLKGVGKVVVGLEIEGH